ncbi:MAG: DUF2812 domain-containing protein [Firmicutes bacterium]|nr:DUF2812 domain-containing protein [Bacillota bacterium]
MKIIDNDYREYKTEWLQIMPYDYARVEEHLAEMAADGWMLDEIRTFSWKYRKCEPRAMKFSVTFLNKESWKELVDGEAVLDSYCKAAGWKKLISWQRMQIYYTDDLSAVALETDEISRLDNTWEAIRESYMPMAMLLLMSLIMNMYTHRDSVFDLGVFSTTMTAVGALMFAYWRWYRKSAESIENGGTCCSMKGINICKNIMLTAAITGLIVYCVSTGTIIVAVIVLVTLGLLAATGRKKTVAEDSVRGED